MPARAATIALATAYQESKLYNLESGDRDSLGLFQQRPSQGWGSPEQVLDPYYATNAFYDALAEVDGYETMEVTDAAQEVQRSGFPEAYADHEADARVLASALTGNSPRAFSCRSPASPDAERDRLTDVRADRAAPTSYGVRSTSCSATRLGGFAPGGVTTGHMEGSAHYEGRAVDIFVAADQRRQQDPRLGDRAVPRRQADRLDIRTVIFDDRIWTSGALRRRLARLRPARRAGDRRSSSTATTSTSTSSTEPLDGPRRSRPDSAMWSSRRRTPRAAGRLTARIVTTPSTRSAAPRPVARPRDRAGAGSATA